jgi:hypothetical protein
LPVELQNVIPGDTSYIAILSVCCDTILDNIKYLDREKMELVVPEGGIIFPPKEVISYEGESVFNRQPYGPAQTIISFSITESRSALNIFFNA